MIPTHDPQTDLLLPLPPAGETWNEHTVYNYCSLLNVPEAELGVFTYVKCKPAFPLAEGGVCIFRGFGNHDPVDMAFQDYQNTMPWPGLHDNKVALANGFTVHIVEPGKKLHLTYQSPDGRTSIDVEQTALTPLLARGHVIPGEEKRTGAAGQLVGGSEQCMRSVGEIVLDGQRFDVDCTDFRDRSWGQIRSEYRDSTDFAPAIWTPVYYDDLVFNQVGYEAPDTNPSWRGIWDLPEDRPTHHFAWVHVDGETREVNRVHLDVLERHPVLHMATKFEIEAEDIKGDTYSFKAEAIAMTALPTWPHSVLRQALYRWEDSRGRVAYNSAQEMWWDQKYTHAMNARVRDAPVS